MRQSQRQMIAALGLLLLLAGATLVTLTASLRVALIAVAVIVVAATVVQLFFLRRIATVLYSIRDSPIANQTPVSPAARDMFAPTELLDKLDRMERDLPERVAVRSAIDIARLRTVLIEEFESASEAAPRKES